MMDIMARNVRELIAMILTLINILVMKKFAMGLITTATAKLTKDLTRIRMDGKLVMAIVMIITLR
jgi:trimethylamine:corrinoid methyltransferase-like protein